MTLSLLLTLNQRNKICIVVNYKIVRSCLNVNTKAVISLSLQKAAWRFTSEPTQERNLTSVIMNHVARHLQPKDISQITLEDIMMKGEKTITS